MLASNHVKTLLLFEEFTTSWVLMHDRQRLCCTIKNGKCQISACFPTCPGSHTYLTHTLSYGNLVAQKSKETRDNFFWQWPQWRWHVLSKSSEGSRTSGCMKGPVQPVVQSEAPSHCSAETAIMISLACCTVTLAAYPLFPELFLKAGSIQPSTNAVSRLMSFLFISVSQISWLTTKSPNG